MLHPHFHTKLCHICHVTASIAFKFLFWHSTPKTRLFFFPQFKFFLLFWKDSKLPIFIFSLASLLRMSVMLIVVTQAWRLLNVTISSTMQKHFNHSTIYLSIYKKGTLNFPFWNLLFWIANKWWNVNKVGRMGNKLLVKHLRKWTTAFWQRPQQLHTLTKKKKSFFLHSSSEWRKLYLPQDWRTLQYLHSHKTGNFPSLCFCPVWLL